MQYRLKISFKVLILLILVVILVQFLQNEKVGQAPQTENAVTVVAAEESIALPAEQGMNEASPVAVPRTAPETKSTAPVKTNGQNKSQPQPKVKKSSPKPAPKPSSSTSNQGSTPASQIIGTSPVIGPYTQEDYYWLAKMIYAEGGAEPYDGQVAVGAVILHRVASPEYPNTVKEVEFQVIDGHYQFTPVLNGYINVAEPNPTAYRAATDALAGADPSKGAMLYYNPLTSTNKWILSRPVTVVIGNHTFAK
ncbi:MAG TPA: cell wall hydrolase [Verrucomicrobiae bacterium]|nr:cell wall hydrolase [Verrucomicrobiae bacterium]